MAEFLVFFPFGFFVFCVDPGNMGFIWFFIPHLVRGAIALLILKKMPTTHDMVNSISMGDKKAVPFSQIGEFVVTGAYESCKEF